MKKPTKNLYKILFQSLLVTMSLAATFHLLIALIAAIAKADIGYINPLDFLGLSIVFPQHRESPSAAATGWLVLVALFGAIVYTSLHYHVYLALFRESKVGKGLENVSNMIKSYAVPKDFQTDQTTSNGKASTKKIASASPKKTARKR